MYIHIMDKHNNPVISGKLVLMRPHAACSDNHKESCFVVYMHEVVIHNEGEFKLWADRHLKHNSATASGGEPAGSDYDYMQFSVDFGYNQYDFMITETRRK